MLCSHDSKNGRGRWLGTVNISELFLSLRLYVKRLTQHGCSKRACGPNRSRRELQNHEA